jgi:hypothetical protein
VISADSLATNKQKIATRQPRCALEKNSEDDLPNTPAPFQSKPVRLDREMPIGPDLLLGNIWPAAPAEAPLPRRQI